MFRLNKSSQFSAPRLYRFQHSAVQASRLAFDQGDPAALIVLPPVSGKTTVVGAKSVSQICAYFKCKALVLTHKQRIMEQWGVALKIVDPSLNCTKIGGGHQDASGHVVIANVCSLGDERLRSLDPKQFDLLVVDDAFHVAAPQWQRVIHHFQPQMLLGISPTLVRGDGISVGGEFGDNIIHISSIQSLMEAGYYVSPRGFRVSSQIDLNRVRAISPVLNADFQAINERSTYAAVEAYLRYGENLPAIVYGANSKRVAALAHTFNKFGIYAKAANGNTSARGLDEILNYRKPLQILTDFNALIEGYDAPTFKCAVLARPYTVHSARVQMLYAVARTMRRFGSCDHSIIIQVVDHGRHGEVEQIRTNTDFLSVFDIDSGEINEGETDGQLVSDVVQRVEHRRRKNTMETLLPILRNYVYPQRLNGQVANFNPVELIEVIEGFRALVIGDCRYFPLFGNSKRQSRLVEIRHSNGSYQATLITAQGSSPLTVAADVASATRSVKNILHRRGEISALPDVGQDWRNDPATEPQYGYLASLLNSERAHLREMTKGEASDLISVLTVMGPASIAA